jgi:antitoxin (DNA-binding transcriptional repressor) of toxin-antitoxin stability system
MITISIEEIQRDVVSYLHRVAAGETLIVVEANKPVAEIKPVVHAPLTLRPYGLCAGRFVVPDDFDAPLPDDLLDAFEGR